MNMKVTHALAFGACTMATCALALGVNAYVAPTQQAEAATPKAKVVTTKSGKAVSTLKISLKGVPGKVTYKLSTNKKAKGYTAKNGKKAGKKGQRGRYITVKLSGAAAESYNVWYRAYAKGYGYLGWAKNGAKAGTANLDLQKVQVKLVAKTANQMSTDRRAFSSKSGFANKVTGNATIDKKIKRIAKSKKMNLTKCCIWATNNIQYGATGRSDLSSSKQFTKKRLLTEAKSAFNSKVGNCYTYTAAGYYFAKYLGYSTKAVAGTYTSMTSHNVQTFSWTTVKIGGSDVIYDVTRFSSWDNKGITSSDSAYALFAAK